MGEKVKFDIDTDALNEEPVRKVVEKTTPKKATKKSVESTEENIVINVLRNERIVIKFVPRANDNITDKRHIAYGGMVDDAKRCFTVPMLTSGVYKNVLTNNEKAFLEECLGLEYNALSVYNKHNNFWDNYKVRLTKHDNVLDLSDPNDYIAYKVLLANDDLICPSLTVLKNSPKATYQFVILEKNEEFVSTKDKTTNTMKCFEELGRIKDNYDVIKCVVETIDGRPVAANTKIEFLHSKAIDIINNNPKLFLQTVNDPLLDTKILIKKAVEKGVITRRGDFYHYNGQPMCNNNEDPTFLVAAKYLSAPKNQELKFAVEAKVNSD